MKKMTCKACGAEALMPMDVSVEKEEGEIFLESESHFFSCYVCGDNWLSLKEETGIDCQITFVHQMGVAPILKRIAHMQTKFVLDKKTVNRWEYFLDDQRIDEDIWRDKLNDRRMVLKSVCTN